MFQTLVRRRVSFKGWGEGTARCLSAITDWARYSLAPPTHRRWGTERHRVLV